MGRRINSEDFGKRNYSLNSRKPKSVVIILLEYNSLEYNYFTKLKLFQDNLEINNIIIVETFDNYCPIEITNILDFITHQFSDLDASDKIWIYFDKIKLKESSIVLEDITSKYPLINIAGATPCFELWIFFHFIDDLKKYNEDVLLNNKKTNNKNKKYFDKIIKELTGSYPMSSIDDLMSLDQIHKALYHESMVQNNPLNSTKLSSNIGDIVSKILE